MRMDHDFRVTFPIFRYNDQTNQQARYILKFFKYIHLPVLNKYTTPL